MKIVDVLKEIADRHDGRITPEQVVEEAKKLPVGNPLHDYFEWDNRKAGSLYRTHQARQLLSADQHSFNVSPERALMASSPKTPMFVRDPEAAAGEQGYISTARLKKPDMKEQARAAVLDAFGRAGTAMRNARHLALFLGQAEIIDRAIASLEADQQAFTAKFPVTKKSSRRPTVDA